MISLHEHIRSQLCSFGTRLQELRLRRNWTLQELADRTSLSKAFLSRLESGDRQASIAAVLTLSRIFGVSLASLFEPEQAPDPCVIVRGSEAVERKANGLAYAPLSKTSQRFNIEPIRVRISKSRHGEEHYHHDGEEWIYVLTGALTISLAGKTYDLEAGDAAHFDSTLPHRLICRSQRDAEVLLVASPLAPLRMAAGEARAIPSARTADSSFSAELSEARPAGGRARGAKGGRARRPIQSLKSPRRSM
jgi:transcriptional regulator with XRE-family HTH domain